MGTPTSQDLKAMIQMNLIRNNSVTTEDVDLATKVFGPDIGAIKGKTTRSRPTQVINNKIDIPEELLDVQEDITLSIDGIVVNSLKFLTTISHNIYYRTSHYIRQPVTESYVTSMNEVVNVYKKGGFHVKEIHADNEFKASMDPFAAKQQPPITMNYTSANEHVPRAERNNRTIKERVRATYHMLPYDQLP